MDYIISLNDVLLIMKKNAKIVIVFAVIFALLFGGYKAYSNMRSIELNEEEKVKDAVNNYNQWKKYKDYSQYEMSKDLVSAYGVLKEHPLMALDPNYCTARNIIFSFNESIEVSRVSTIKGWIDSVSCKQLFNNESDILKKYRSDLVTVNGSYGEVNVVVFAISEYNLDSVAKNIVKLIKKKCRENSIKIIDVQNNKNNGYSQTLFEKQDVLRNNIARLQSETAAVKNGTIDQIIDSTGNSTKDYVMVGIFALAGMIFGIALALVLLLFKIVRKGTLVSDSQIEKRFGIDKIGELVIDNKNSIVIIDTIVDAIIEEEKNVLVVSDNKDDELNDMINSVRDLTKKQYIVGTANEDDISFINTSKNANSLIIPLRMGKTTQDNVKHVIRWSQKYKKQIIGYTIIK